MRRPGDTINFNCTGLGANESVAVVQASGLAAYDNPANEESYADLSHANLAGSANASGDYNQNLNSAYTNGDTNVTAPPSLVAENLGSQSNLVTAADEGTQDPLILVNLAFTGGVSPDADGDQPVAVRGEPQRVDDADHRATPRRGYWWGAGNWVRVALRRSRTRPSWLTARRSAAGCRTERAR